MIPSGRLILSLPNGREQVFELAKTSVVIGRAPENDIVLSGERVSRSHAGLEATEEGWTIQDLGSANGTCVNGEKVEEATLEPGDLIRLGRSEFRFESDAPAAGPEETVLDTPEDLEATLLETRLEMTLNDVALPRLVIHTADKTWEIALEGDSLIIGRDPESNLVLDQPSLSRHHARIERVGEAFLIRDLQSANGTWLRGDRIDEHVLEDGDTVRIGSAQLVFKSGFKREALTSVGASVTDKKDERRPVVIVPGLMGSELWRGSEQMWPNVRTLFSRADVFRLPEFEPMEARALVREVVIVPNLIKLEQYNRLGDYLEEGLSYERGKDLLEFPYDWRQDVRLSAQRLAEAIEGWRVKPPVVIIAHSLGCLVSRYYVERLGGKDRVERLILLGGPHSGVPSAIDSLHMGPGLLPFGILRDRLREVLVTFPSMYQILPTYSCVVDQEKQPINILEDESWITEAQRPLLRSARELRREIGDRSSVPAVSIFGYGIKTVTQLQVKRDAEGHWEEMNRVVEPNGDSRVPERSAILEQSEIHPVQQHHGALYVDNDVKMRLKLELGV